MDNKRKNILIASLFLLGGISLFVPFFISPFDGLNEDQNFFLDVAMGVTLFFVFNYISIWLQITGVEAAVQRQIAQGFKVRQVGLPHQIVEQLNRDILSAHQVRNTFVGIHDLGVENIYRQWLTNPENGLWEDIVGIPEFFSKRFVDISIEGQQYATHKIYVLREFSHIINFIILEFPNADRDDTVYFGWIANDSRQVSQIFSSSDKDVVRMFRNQYANLLKITWNAIPEIENVFKGGFQIDHTYPVTKKVQLGPPSLVDKSGTWETLSFQKNERGDIIVTSFAVVKIAFNGDQVNVRSKVFDCEGQFLYDFTSNSDSTYSLNNIFFIYKLTFSEVTGVCHYKFSRHTSGHRVLTGTFCDSDFEKRNSVIGFYQDNEISFKDYSQQLVGDRIAAIKNLLSIIDPDQELSSGPEIGLLGINGSN